MPKIDPENRFEKLILRFNKQIKYADQILRLVGIVVISLFLLELFSFLLIETHRKIYSVMHSGISRRKINEEIYENKKWLKGYFKEYESVYTAEYHPYVGFRTKPNFVGKYINIDSEGLRKTYNQCLDKEGDTLNIFVFGGSAIWGVDVPDESTIPSYLAKSLCEQGFEVEVTNFGVSGYTSTQDVLRLLIELKDENVPDMAIFYNGYNDVWSTIQNNKAGLPQNVENRKREFNALKKPVVEGFFSNFYSIVREIVMLISPGIAYDLNYGQLNSETANTYLSNINLVKALEEDYGFTSFFFWQPVLYTKNELSDSEKTYISYDHDMAEDYQDVTKQVIISDDVIDLSNVFNETNSTYFLDQAHVSEEGNEIIAEKISEVVSHYLLELDEDE